jgi:hypothetical protein
VDGSRPASARHDTRDGREDICASNNDDKFNLGFEPVPTAAKPDF